MANLLRSEGTQYQLIRYSATNREAQLAPARKSYIQQIVLAYLISFGFAEFISRRSLLLAGFYLLAVLISLLIHANHPNAPQQERRIIGTLVLVPLLRLLGYTMFMPQLSEIYWIALVGVPTLGAAMLTARFLDDGTTPWATPEEQMRTPQVVEQPPNVQRPAQRSALDIQLPHTQSTLHGWPLQLLFALLSVPLALIAYRLNPTPAFGSTDTWATFVLGIGFVVLFAGLTEAYIFYGLIQRVFSESFAPPIAVVYTTFLVTLMYIRVPNVEYGALVLIVALLFSLWVQLTRTVWGVALAHSSMLLLLFYLLPRLTL